MRKREREIEGFGSDAAGVRHAMPGGDLPHRAGSFHAAVREGRREGGGFSRRTRYDDEVDVTLLSMSSHLSHFTLC